MCNASRKQRLEHSGEAVLQSSEKENCIIKKIRLNKLPVLWGLSCTLRSNSGYFSSSG